MITPTTSTTSWSRFPPLTREAQFDKKWSFVAKKEKNCDETDPADDRKGDAWDHVAIDVESRLVISVVTGERTAENIVAVVNDFKRRTGGWLVDLITTDGYLVYEDAILDAYGETITPPRTGKRGGPKAPYKVARKGLTYAVVEKTREKGRVVAIATRVVFGTMAAVITALGMSKASRSINTSLVERQNGTDRHRNARKARKTYRFSKRLAGSRIGDLSDDVRLQFLLGRFGHYGSRTTKAFGGTGARRWRAGWPIMSGRFANGWCFQPCDTDRPQRNCLCSCIYFIILSTRCRP